MKAENILKNESAKKSENRGEEKSVNLTRSRFYFQYEYVLRT